MRIGIVTQPLKGNYGGILQNYALQQVLLNLKHAPITLDFMWGASGFNYLFLALRVFVAHFRGRASRWLPEYAPSRTNTKISNFVDEYIITTKTFWNRYSPKLVKKYDLDTIIVGSDQVWRPQYNPCLKDSFLAFTGNQTIRRIAYAASFGTSSFEYNKSQIAKCSKLLKQFDAVSVREASGIEILKKLGVNIAVKVLDPTLLLGREGFEALLPQKLPLDLGIRYVGAYILDTNPEIETNLTLIANSYGASKIVNITENMPGIGPLEWLSIIRNSYRFITDSFHGTVFCILFHIPFVTIVNKSRGADRFDSLLAPLGLSGNMVWDLTEIVPEKFHITWDCVDIELEKMRKSSLDFIVDSLR